MSQSPITEGAINVVSEGTVLQGKLIFDQTSRVYGTLLGEVVAKPGSTLILSETSVVEGSIQADTLFIDGYVKGDIQATGRVSVSGTGRVIGNIRTPRLVVEFGAYFEGRTEMENVARIAEKVLAN